MGWRFQPKSPASILIFYRCSWILNEESQATALDRDARKQLKENIIDRMAIQGLRTICVAYKDFSFCANQTSVSSLETLPAASNDALISEEPEWDNEDEVMKNLTCIAIFGIEDPVRPEVYFSNISQIGSFQIIEFESKGFNL